MTYAKTTAEYDSNLKADLDRAPIKPRYIVMTARARMPSRCWGQYGRVAVVETDGQQPSRIDPRDRRIRRIVAQWERRNIGGARSAFALAVREAEEMAAKLNGDTA